MMIKERFKKWLGQTTEERQQITDLMKTNRGRRYLNWLKVAIRQCRVTFRWGASFLLRYLSFDMEIFLKSHFDGL